VASGDRQRFAAMMLEAREVLDELT
jgi:hypothetical protein